MDMLGNFEMTSALGTQNSGCSVWGFGRRDGTEYFIKRFLSPVYPEGDTVSSPERQEKKRQACARFERQKTELYRVVNAYSDGNAVRIQEFFRLGSKYYCATRRMEALPWDIETVCSLAQEEKVRLCSIISHTIARLHEGGLIHADLKHENILFTQSASGKVTAKIIDFDSGFLESDPPAPGTEIVGDLIYFSPEALQSMSGEAVTLTCKMDVFALGVLFHRYLTGELPYFDQEQYGFPAGAAANGGAVWVSEALDPDLAGLLQSMLDPRPEYRPTAWQVFEALRGPEAQEEISADRISQASIHEEPQQIEQSTAWGNPFYRPGDL